MKSMHRMPFGVELLEAGGARFRLWAPACDSVQLELLAPERGAKDESLAMYPAEGGWHAVDVGHVGPGTLYRFRLPNGLGVPDPASRFNPMDVHGPSEVVDPKAYAWMDDEWRGRPWHTAVLYELHLGTFTPSGRLDAALEHLRDLQRTGINTVELMPLADFPGARGWGYDGVLQFAPEASYGRPDDLKRFVDTAHGLGMMVILDVVYNHFGPDGNYLSAYCPQFFDRNSNTPWGWAINFDGPGSETVRRFFIDNALFWVEEYHLDGLRLDAVHAIRDQSARHIVAEIADSLQSGPAGRREVHLVLENEANTARWLTRDDDGRPLIASAQWNDDLHHAAHVLATRETFGYYADYAEDSVALLGRSLAEGFVFQGQASTYHGGVARGERSSALPSQAFVGFLQNHDQIGNRAFGERLDAIAEPGRVDLLLVCLLLSPHVPMLFMGEEFAASTPFQYFCDYRGELASAVTQGRRAQFDAIVAAGEVAEHGEIPDPNAESTFHASRLNWGERETERGQKRLALVSRLLALRRELLEPLLPLQRRGGVLECGEGWFAVEWAFGQDVIWTLRANFGTAAVDLAAARDEHRIYRSDPTLADSPANSGSITLEGGAVMVAVRHGLVA